MSTLRHKEVFAMKALWLGCICFVLVSCAVAQDLESGSSETMKSQNPLEPVEISMPAEVNGMVLDGILTVPSRGEKFPVVMLVHGSGPSDMDETVYQNKPFRDIAHGLATYGIATYRYNKSTFAYPMKFAEDTMITVYDETINDAVGISEMLRKVPQVDATRVYVLGHSLGGHVVPLIAKETELAGYIIMAGNVRFLGELLAEQIPYLLQEDGVVSPEEQSYLDMVEAELAKLENLSIIPQNQPILGAYKNYWSFFVEYDALESAQAITRPVLVLQGERDYQVSMEEFALWQGAFGNSDTWQFISYPGLNHLMMTGTGPSYPSEYMIPGSVSSDVIEDIGKWIGESE